ncbi:uncharacterized protein LOC111380673 [Olea europaea subsp. europaea]|uniref:Uncharacterized protein LOC111380673 n=1 Tax=Olea europaea subsp. europaea TaxID=158383 RepID=A0A8S0TWE2_OLEEU|nr:uncharacterized protein LOC111380673 [Olea europaea subsp. europaea]
MKFCYMGRVSSTVNTVESAYSVPSMAPTVSGSMESENHLSSFYNSVNAVSFGFVATAILISMFLVMAIFERFLRPRSTAAEGGHSPAAVENMRSQGKFNYPSPKMTVYANGVSVLMPGEEIPTFIAHPAPATCPSE